MQKNEVVILPVVPGYVSDIWSILEPLAKDISVLNVGAAGNVEFYMDGRRHLWMHERLRSIAGELIGLDIDAESVAYANARGESLILGNCESVDLGRRFDLVVLSEVIEHVNAPVDAISNLTRHLNPGGKLFITTPNPTYYGIVVRSLLNRSLNIYYDHTAAYFPENLFVICRRLKLKVSGIYFYNAMDGRTLGLEFKSWLARQIGRVFHRYGSNYIFIIEAS